ncbi:hypothetical protein [Candidatus Methylobacter oryzae]|uniref:Uncharacterized protein n=1 Tax=Candidatus Methylobacter oryzae TaxID=2497749 RepID=A0ABY3C7Z1_9GAMM|nr:hypothetical protein [Candidatus Methylobacter oryzae]TRW91504.1 hypothetical protein EKO24_016445 [Candidatus Methylobacter oryzae]
MGEVESRLEQRSRATQGAVAEAEHKFAWSEFEQPIRLARRAKTKDGFRSEVTRPRVREPDSINLSR